MRLALACATALFFAQSASALYFYLAAGENRCFIEEIPKDTIVVGESHLAAKDQIGCLRATTRPL